MLRSIKASQMLAILTEKSCAKSLCIVVWRWMSLTIDQIKEKIIPTLKEAGVVRSSLFGSIVRGEDTPESDVDILVEFSPDKTPGLFGFVGLQQRLEDVLSKKVDLLTFNSLNHLLKDRILKEQVPIYDER